MLLKGILVGILFAAISIVLFIWIYLGMPLRFPASDPNAGVTSFDLRALKAPAISFFGGVAIGFAIVMAVIFGGIQAIKLYLLHRFPTLQRS